MNDIDILIPLFIDHSDRLKNCERIVHNLQSYGINNIFIKEYYFDNPKAESLATTNVNYSSSKTEDNFFNKMKCINELSRLTKNKYLAVYDVDVIIVKKDIKKAIEMLEEGWDFVYPYNGKFYDVPKDKIENFLKTKSIEVKDCNLFHPNSCGGCVIFKRDVFEKGGRCNPNFKNVGFDDDELKARFSKLEFKMGRTTSPLFHLEHTRTHTSYGISQYDRFNQQEFYRISNMSKVQLLEEISKWK